MQICIIVQDGMSIILVFKCILGYFLCIGVKGVQVAIKDIKYPLAYNSLEHESLSWS